MRIRVPSVVTVLAAAVTVALPASAHAATALGFGPAELRANGAAITVNVRYSCPVGSDQGSVGVDVSQAVGRRLATGFGHSPNLVCDGAARMVAVNVPVNYNSVSPFRRGVAWATAHLSSCAEGNCQESAFSGEITVRR
jgi:hypothetical protein